MISKDSSSFVSVIGGGTISASQECIIQVARSLEPPVVTEVKHACGPEWLVA